MKAVWYVIVKENDKNYLVLQEKPVTTFWFHHIDKIEGLKPDIKSTSDLWNAVSFFLGGGADFFFLPQLTAESVKYSYTDAGNGISIRL